MCAQSISPGGGAAPHQPPPPPPHPTPPPTQPHDNPPAPPPERELARELKISRSSLRAGIGFLSAMGVLKSRHGAGTFVSSGPPALDSSLLTVLGAPPGFLPSPMFEIG